MYEEHGGCPSAGVVVKIGKISGKQCIVVANDATVKAGLGSQLQERKTLEPKKSPWKTDCQSSIW